jgi:SAM-dependent methyltransferase
VRDGHLSVHRFRLNLKNGERGSCRLGRGRFAGGPRELLADDYFGAGAREVVDFMRRAAVLGYPRQRQEALDFGCGLGRVTRALADHFAKVVGVDISADTVGRARALNADYPNCRFLVFDEPDLEPFEDDRFDMIYTVLELKQESDALMMLALAREFLRILKPAGLLMLRVTDRLSFRNMPERRRLVTRMWRLLSEVPGIVHGRLRGRQPHPIATSQKDLLELVITTHAQVLQIDARRRSTRRRQGESRTFWVTK